MKKYEVSEELLNSILQYLASKPYQEVFQMVQTIQKEAKPTQQDIPQEHISKTLDKE